MPIFVSFTPSFSPLTGLVEVVDPEDAPRAALAQWEGLKELKSKMKAFDPCSLSGERRPNPIPKRDTVEGLVLY